MTKYKNPGKMLLVSTLSFVTDQGGKKGMAGKMDRGSYTLSPVLNSV